LKKKQTILNILSETFKIIGCGDIGIDGSVFGDWSLLSMSSFDLNLKKSNKPIKIKTQTTHATTIKTIVVVLSLIELELIIEVWFDDDDDDECCVDDVLKSFVLESSIKIGDVDEVDCTEGLLLLIVSLLTEVYDCWEADFDCVLVAGLDCVAAGDFDFVTLVDDDDVVMLDDVDWVKNAIQSSKTPFVWLRKLFFNFFFRKNETIIKTIQKIQNNNKPFRMDNIRHQSSHLTNSRYSINRTRFADGMMASKRVGALFTATFGHLGAECHIVSTMNKIKWRRHDVKLWLDWQKRIIFNQLKQSKVESRLSVDIVESDSFEHIHINMYVSHFTYFKKNQQTNVNKPNLQWVPLWWWRDGNIPTTELNAYIDKNIYSNIYSIEENKAYFLFTTAL